MDEYTYGPDLWPAADIFSYTAYRSSEDYKTIIKSTEASLNAFSDELQIIILATYTDDDQARKLLLNTPESENMAKI